MEGSEEPDCAMETQAVAAEQLNGGPDIFFTMGFNYLDSDASRLLCGRMLIKRQANGLGNL